MFFFFLAIFLIWFLVMMANSGSTSSSSYTSKSAPSSPSTITKSNVTVPTRSSAVVTRPTVRRVEKPVSISVSPTSISAHPLERFSLIQGEYRTFQNYYIEGKQYSFGFPHRDCRDKRVWVGKQRIEVGRVSLDEAIRIIDSGRIRAYLS